MSLTSIVVVEVSSGERVLAAFVLGGAAVGDGDGDGGDVVATVTESQQRADSELVEASVIAKPSILTRQHQRLQVTVSP